jgi:hypothetical protein
MWIICFWILYLQQILWLVAHVLENYHYNNKDLYIVSYTSMYNTLKTKVQFNNSLNIQNTPKNIFNLLTIWKLLCLPVVKFYLITIPSIFRSKISMQNKIYYQNNTFLILTMIQLNRTLMEDQSVNHNLYSVKLEYEFPNSEGNR